MARALSRARLAGFTLSSEPEVGRILAALAASVPRGGLILELGTGAGVGLAWITSGLGERRDVRVLSMECDPAVARIALEEPWPEWVEVRVADALAELPRLAGLAGLVFADSIAGKLEGLDLTIAALAPGGLLVLDDMAPREDPLHRELMPRIAAAGRAVREHPGLVSVDIDWGVGILLASRRSGRLGTP